MSFTQKVMSFLRYLWSPVSVPGIEDFSPTPAAMLDTAPPVPSNKYVSSWTLHGALYSEKRGGRHVLSLARGRAFVRMIRSATDEHQARECRTFTNAKGYVVTEFATSECPPSVSEVVE